jgi:hypothetical protein
VITGDNSCDCHVYVITSDDSATVCNVSVITGDDSCDCNVSVINGQLLRLFITCL